MMGGLLDTVLPLFPRLLPEGTSCGEKVRGGKEPEIQAGMWGCCAGRAVVPGSHSRGGDSPGAGN